MPTHTHTHTHAFPHANTIGATVPHGSHEVIIISWWLKMISQLMYDVLMNVQCTYRETDGPVVIWPELSPHTIMLISCLLLSVLTPPLSVSSRPMGKALCGVFTPSSGPCWCKPWRNSTSQIHMLSALLRPPLLGINTGLIIWQMQNSDIYQGSRNNACLLLIRISEVYSVNCHKKTFPVQTALLNIVGGI